MAGTGRERHRDRDRGMREFGESEVQATNRVFRMTDAQREQIAKSLRYIDESRRALEAMRNPDNREIIRELKASADRIFDLVNELEEIDGEPS